MAAKITYQTSDGPPPVVVTLTFVRGPVDLKAYWNGRTHDNLATSGAVRERVVEALDILIDFQMPHLLVNGDIEAWASFMAFALPGATFKFFPCDTLTDYYNCVLEDQGWEPQRNAPRKYGAAMKFRVLNDAQAPASPAVVLRRFHGLAN